MKGLLMSILTGTLLAMAAFPARAADQSVWRFDNLSAIGGAAVHVEGEPKLIDTPAGKALWFDGVDDVVYVDKHPLAGAARFTWEATFRPDGGAFEQRWMHLSEIDPATGKDSDARFLFEIRVVEDQWYLDAFVTGPGYKCTLAVPEKTFPVGKWYHVAQTFDGKTYKAYVDGVLQAEGEIDFKAQGEGHTSAGARINQVSWFHGAIFDSRFTAKALSPSEFEKIPAGLK